jgi:hypothetical protein
MGEDEARQQAKRLGEAFENAPVRLDCPSCGHGEWSPYEFPIILLASGGTGGGLHALAAVCDRCGFIRLHAAQILDEYVKFHG